MTPRTPITGEEVADVRRPKRICNAEGYHATAEAAALVERYNALPDSTRSAATAARQQGEGK